MKRPSALHKVTLGCGLLSIAAAIGIPATAQQKASAPETTSIVSNADQARPVYTPSYVGSPDATWTVGLGTSFTTGAVSFTHDGAPVAPDLAIFTPGSSLPAWVKINSSTGALTIAPPADATPGYYPIAINVVVPDATASNLYAYILVTEKNTGSENTGSAAYYNPVPVPPAEPAVPGLRSAVDLIFYSYNSSEVVSGADLLATGKLDSIVLPADARPWVSINGSSVLFDLPADIPAGVSGIWQTVQVVYTDGTSEYVNVILPVDTSQSSAPTAVPTPAPTATSTSAEPATSPAPTATAVPSATISSSPTAIPSVAPSIIPTIDAFPAPTAEPAPSASAKPSTNATPTVSADPTPSPALEPTASSSAEATSESSPSATATPSASETSSAYIMAPTPTPLADAPVAVEAPTQAKGVQGWLAHTGASLVPYLWVAGMSLLAGGAILMSRDRRRGY